MFTTLPTLNWTVGASVSTTTTLVALLLPVFVTVTVYARSVPGGGLTDGATLLFTVKFGAAKIRTTSLPVPPT